MIAKVALELSLDKEFDYLIPSALAHAIEVGSRVRVPFGHRHLFGYVTGLPGESARTDLKPIQEVVGGQSLVTPGVLRLARWMADYYCCPLEIALKSVLPVAVRKEQAGWKKQLVVRLRPVAGELPKLSKRQRSIWHIVEEWRELSLQKLIELTGTTAATIRRLEDKGVITISAEVAERDPYAHEQILPTQPLALNSDQARAFAEIKTALDRLLGGQPSGQGTVECLPEQKRQPSSKPFLLHGVTGSGKTEVYLQAISHTLEQGKGAIVLVPEISLTPQTVERFKARFTAGTLKTLVAVLHSHLSTGERHDEWHKIRQGRARIVVGARSAVFAPVQSLGLIVVDEEHEPSYKQEEAPRYHARDLAVMRGQMENAVVVLGSATPSLESYYNVKQRKYALIEMPCRADDKTMPVVRIVDMRQEARKEKGAPIFSQKLKEAIHKRLEKKEQIMLFLNRRGFATSLQCPRCGYVAGCPNCSVALTYHRAAQKLLCHICAHTSSAPTRCPAPNCLNPAIRYAGLGTEKVEEALIKLFPGARIKRMDSDALKRKEDYRRFLGDFRTGKTDILLGTQMIAKGLHFPNVTLVGIIHADLSLHQPDFRAGERTFQLLTQVAGRAGRGEVEGEVIVQAFTPFHPAIQYARRHDFIAFYDQEIEFREQLGYPPVKRAALLTLKGRNEDKVKFAASYLRRELAPLEVAMPEIVIAGPAPAPLARSECFYRYQIFLRSRQMPQLSRWLSAFNITAKLPDEVQATIDIDPMNLS